MNRFLFMIAVAFIASYYAFGSTVIAEDAQQLANQEITGPARSAAATLPVARCSVNVLYVADYTTTNNYRGPGFIVTMEKDLVSGHQASFAMSTNPLIPGWDYHRGVIGISVGESHDEAFIPLPCAPPGVLNYNWSYGCEPKPGCESYIERSSRQLTFTQKPPISK